MSIARLRKYLLGAGYVLFGLCLGAYFFRGPVMTKQGVVAKAIPRDYKGPVLDVVNGKLQELGAIEPGATVRAKWVLKNNGKGALNVTTLQVSCDCTKVSLPKGETKVLAPGESYNLLVDLSTQAGLGGEMTRTIKLATNDSSEKSVTLTMHYQEIAMIVGRLPSRIHIPRLPAGKDHPFEFQFYSPRNKVFRVLEVASDDANARAELRPLQPDEKRGAKFPADYDAYRVTVTLLSTVPAGAFAYTLTVKTDFERLAALTTKITGVKPFVTHPPNEIAKN